MQRGHRRPFAGSHHHLLAPCKTPRRAGGVKREFNPVKQDVIWDKELCIKCALEIESLINDEPDDSDSSGDVNEDGGATE